MGAVIFGLLMSMALSRTRSLRDLLNTFDSHGGLIAALFSRELIMFSKLIRRTHM